ncbi:3'-phosphoesterase [candidate division MSBL1 archaeon SCGC-AAA259A05]|uniref:3'-phosphoesterase n=1 Tax=candidate division MSBL1 archaeon SCGC-AAA259A05 TaxID=1698259 RepID=A0A133UBZ4_9EURY|nr:3'-phosphoesterase [candidate division MSBL1 archaeon SCGC-AAA259A05]
MSLEEYKKKRKFHETPEPPGTQFTEGNSRIYVIQRHDASKLHHDLRLEMNGVLKSWAIPKEPPTKKGIKRLAIKTEDHPLGYANFEGTIPEGQYGAGGVEIWDEGEYELLERKPNENIIVKIKGEKLRGKYCLINFSGEEKNWLFFKCD